MIDFTQIEITNLPKTKTGAGGYTVVDARNGEMLLQIEFRKVRATTPGRWTDYEHGNVEIYDVRGTSGRKDILKSIPAKAFNHSHVSEVVLSTLESLLCEECHKEWGPICDSCYQETIDATFLSFRQIERLADG